MILLDREYCRRIARTTAETAMKMAGMRQEDPEWRKETASTIALSAELAIRMLASGTSKGSSVSEALFWASFFGGKGKKTKLKTKRKETGLGFLPLFAFEEFCGSGYFRRLGVII